MESKPKIVQEEKLGRVRPAVIKAPVSYTRHPLRVDVNNRGRSRKIPPRRG